MNARILSAIELIEQTSQLKDLQIYPYKGDNVLTFIGVTRLENLDSRLDKLTLSDFYMLGDGLYQYRFFLGLGCSLTPDVVELLSKFIKATHLIVETKPEYCEVRFLVETLYEHPAVVKLFAPFIQGDNASTVCAEPYDESRRLYTVKCYNADFLKPVSKVVHLREVKSLKELISLSSPAPRQTILVHQHDYIWLSFCGTVSTSVASAYEKHPLITLSNTPNCDSTYTYAAGIAVPKVLCNTTIELLLAILGATGVKFTGASGEEHSKVEYVQFNLPTGLSLPISQFEKYTTKPFIELFAQWISLFENNYVLQTTEANVAISTSTLTVFPVPSKGTQTVTRPKPRTKGEITVSPIDTVKGCTTK